MDPSPSTTQSPSDNRIFLNGKQLAEVLGVAPPSLTEAVKNGYNCGGYPVSEWAVELPSGRIKGYDVPEFLVSGEFIKETRPNPTENKPNSPSFSPNKGDSIVKEATEIINNYSLLPEGEDYVRPIGMITLPSVLKKALEKDTPQSRAVIAGGLGALGALVGHAVTDNASGAGIGAGTGLTIALLVYKYFKPVLDGTPLEFGINQKEERLNKNQPIHSFFYSN
ncbi:hypothetical protein [Rhodohalobacter barkolensis]|uniref:Uncharacterized protein n=1 Tax=Rhodohalobacter barkolensis TaxID=2053187 RepID=A0A2N0VHU5_9BACT|nr:hypothetical protein [Rhodohalobacter barkolensis]PKD43708.1 hypothetical protein CWD77_09110 [Rhodohalobacter barkolensis]